VFTVHNSLEMCFKSMCTGIASKYTSFIAVKYNNEVNEQSSEVCQALMRTEVIPSMIPALLPSLCGSSFDMYAQSYDSSRFW